MFTIELDTKALRDKIVKNVVASYHNDIMTAPNMTVSEASTTIDEGTPATTSYTLTPLKTLYKIQYGRDLKANQTWKHRVTNPKRSHPVGTPYNVVWVRGRRLSPQWNAYMMMNQLARLTFGNKSVTEQQWEAFVQQYTDMGVYAWRAREPIPIGAKRPRIMWSDAPEPSWWTPPEIIPAVQSGEQALQDILTHLFREQ